jgi:hypothetical protein
MHQLAFDFENGSCDLEDYVALAEELTGVQVTRRTCWKTAPTPPASSRFPRMIGRASLSTSPMPTQALRRARRQRAESGRVHACERAGKSRKRVAAAKATPAR